LAETPQSTAVTTGSRLVTNHGPAYWVALGADVVAFIAALLAPGNAGAFGQMIGSLPHPFLATVLSALFPLLGLGALVAGGRGRWKRQLLVVVAGLGICGVAAAWVLLSGPRYPSFLVDAEGASPGDIATSAIVSAAAALVMIVADGISWRHATERRAAAHV
jgi:hypothetical protein